MAAVNEPLYSDWGQFAKLAKAANLADAALHLVEAMVVRLEVYASSNKPIGSVRGFPVAAVAAHWDLSVERLERIYAALKHPDVRWIDHD